MCVDLGCWIVLNRTDGFIYDKQATSYAPSKNIGSLFTLGFRSAKSPCLVSLIQGQTKVYHRRLGRASMETLRKLDECHIFPQGNSNTPSSREGHPTLLSLTDFRASALMCYGFVFRRLLGEILSPSNRRDVNKSIHQESENPIWCCGDQAQAHPKAVTENSSITDVSEERRSQGGHDESSIRTCMPRRNHSRDYRKILLSIK